jgi:hypothetical protein
VEADCGVCLERITVIGDLIYTCGDCGMCVHGGKLRSLRVLAFQEGDYCFVPLRIDCYGIPAGTAKNKWRCAVCLNDRTPESSTVHLSPLKPKPFLFQHPLLFLKDYACIVCYRESSKKLNSVKRTLGHNWAHLVCSMWIPEIKFTDTDKLESIASVSQIPAHRWSSVRSV